MKPEQEFYHKVVKGLFDQLPDTDHKRIENKLDSGTPDVTYATVNDHGSNCQQRQWGWLELKVSAEDKHGMVDLRHFTGQQKNWLTDMNVLGGGCYLFLKVDDYLFLIAPWQAYTITDRVSLKYLMEISCRIWSLREGITPESFIEGLLCGEHQIASGA